MTSTHTNHSSHGSHSPHSSHGSHGSHGNHGPHASHGSHGPHGSHGNSTTNTSTPSWDKTITGDHSVTAPVQQASSISTNKLGVYGSTGSLSALKSAAEAAKAASAFTSQASAYTIPDGQVANQASLTAVLNSAQGSIARYRNGTIKVNYHTNHGNSMGAGSPNHGSHANTSVTNTDSQANAGVNLSSTINTGSGGHSNTAKTAHANSSITSPVYNTSVNPAYSVGASGTKITSAQLSGILAQIKKITSSNVPTFGTATFTGSLNAAHGSHGSHNSHGSHASHGSHGPHGSHGSHSSHSNHGPHTNHGSHSSCSLLLKENMLPITFNALDLIKDINVVSFNYKPGTGYDPTITHYGFIAEHTDEKFSTQYHDRMDYTNCIGLLIKAVQELAEKIN